MATKPSDLNVWATDANYTNGDYVGQPTKVEPPAGKQNEGWVPKDKPGAEHQNWWQNLTYQWCLWVDGGESSFNATKHIVETDSLGHAKVHHLTAECNNNNTAIYAYNTSTEGFSFVAARGSNATGGYVAGFYASDGDPDINVYINTEESATCPVALHVDSSQAVGSKAIDVVNTSASSIGMHVLLNSASTSAGRGITIVNKRDATGIEVDGSSGTTAGFKNIWLKGIDSNIAGTCLYIQNESVAAIDIDSDGANADVIASISNTAGNTASTQGLQVRNESGASAIQVGSFVNLGTMNAISGRVLSVFNDGATPYVAHIDNNANVSNSVLYVENDSTVPSILKIVNTGDTTYTAFIDDSNNNSDPQTTVFLKTSGVNGSRGLRIDAYGSCDDGVLSQMASGEADSSFVAGRFYAGGTSASAGLVVHGGTAGKGIYSESADFACDLNPTGTTHAPLRIQGQTPNPSVFSQGSIFFNTTDDHLKFHGDIPDASTPLAVWGTTGGQVFGFDQDDSPAQLIEPPAGWVDIGSSVFYPRVPINDSYVVITAMVNFRAEGANKVAMDLRLWDDTSNVVISPIVTAYSNDDDDFQQRMVHVAYQLPTGGQRTFTLQGNSSGITADAMLIDSFSLTVFGSFEA